MSQRYVPRTNRVPWMDDIVLITVTKSTDADGYITTTESRKTVHCTFSEGVNRTEFYEAMKAGVKASASVEVWSEDFQGETKAEFGGRTYGIVRSYETGRGTLDLTLSEEVR